MNKSGIILFASSALFLIIKLIVILYGQIEMLRILKEAGNWTSDWIIRYFNYYWLFVEPMLILVSLAGFVMRKAKGFQFSLLYVHFVLAYAFLHYLTPVDKHENFNVGLVTWNLLVVIMINVPATVRVFQTELSRASQIRSNVLAFIIGMALNGVLLVITE